MIERGEVHVVRLNPNRGKEFGKLRPAVILQAWALTSRLGTTIVVPLTRQFRPELAPLRIAVSARDDLKQQSYVAVEQIRVVDVARIDPNRLASLTGEELRRLERSLQGLLGFELDA